MLGRPRKVLKSSCEMGTENRAWRREDKGTSPHHKPPDSPTGDATGEKIYFGWGLEAKLLDYMGIEDLKVTRRETRSANISPRKQGRAAELFIRAAMRVNGIYQGQLLGSQEQLCSPMTGHPFKYINQPDFMSTFYWRVLHLDIEMKLTYDYIICFFLDYYYPVYYPH